MPRSMICPTAPLDGPDRPSFPVWSWWCTEALLQRGAF
jgi:hypothetical protein